MTAVMRRYTFRLYPTVDQIETLHTQRRMMADLWNGLLQRWEDIQRRTMQRRTWHDATGARRRGFTLHCPTWPSECMRDGVVRTMSQGRDGRPKPYSAFDMQNEVTWLFNSLDEWRALSIWCGHRTAQQLARSIEAFYRRAGAGAGAASGYPRYRRRDRHDSIPHRFASGCALLRDPRHIRSWSLRLKGIPGAIHARGIFPAAVSEWADADVMWREGQWWLSVAVEIERTRFAGYRPLTVGFGLIDEFATVDGIGDTPIALNAARVLSDDLDELKAAFDKRWPRGSRRRSDDEYVEYLDQKMRITRLSARIARIRRDALHVWTTRLIARANALTIIAPPVREVTKTPRGDAQSWGASVDVVSELNRSVLSQAPATAISMLKYKAEEAGIRCDVVMDEAPSVAVGGELVTAGKTLRRARRVIKERELA